MKTFLVSAVCLLVGLSAGFFAGYRYYERRITNEAVKQMLDVMESSDGEHAAEATRVIELIESGDSSNAVRILKRPIANYYHWYAVYTDTDRRRKLRAMIEQLAGTNKVVADVIQDTNQ